MVFSASVSVSGHPSKHQIMPCGGQVQFGASYMYQDPSGISDGGAVVAQLIKYGWGATC